MAAPASPGLAARTPLPEYVRKFLLRFPALSELPEEQFALIYKVSLRAMIHMDEWLRANAFLIGLTAIAPVSEVSAEEIRDHLKRELAEVGELEQTIATCQKKLYETQQLPDTNFSKATRIQVLEELLAEAQEELLAETQKNSLILDSELPAPAIKTICEDMRYALKGAASNILDPRMRKVVTGSDTLNLGSDKPEAPTLSSRVQETAFHYFCTMWGVRYSSGLPQGQMELIRERMASAGQVNLSATKV